MKTEPVAAHYGLIDGRFEPIRMLGSGAGGDVVLVRDRNLDGHLLALKILHPHHTLSQAAFGRFRTETRVTMQLSHPNILATYGMGRTAEGITYLKMEYVEGEPLDRIVRAPEYRGEVESVLKILQGVASALRYAHSRGIIHRDLKPANILVAADGTVKVADFGLAYLIRAEARYTRTGDIIGTPHYMAPEVVRGEIPDARSDIYALGMVAYEMFVGRPAFDAESFWELAHCILTVAPPRPMTTQGECVPTWIEEFILRALQKDKHQRFSDMSEVLLALQLVDQDNDEEPPHRTNRDPFAESRPSSSDALTHRTQQHAQRLLKALLWFGILCLIVLPPWLNNDARQKYRTALFFLERVALPHSPLLRQLFNVEPAASWPEIVFGTSPNEQVAIAFLDAGYQPDAFWPPAGGYPLHQAGELGALGLLKALLKAGASLEVVDKHGKTALTIALQHGFQQGAFLLLDSRANPGVPDRSGRLPIHTAARRGRYALVEQLLRAGSPVNWPDMDGLTPLHEAVTAANLDLVRLLLEHGADPNAHDIYGITPLGFLDTTESMERQEAFRRLLSPTLEVPPIPHETGSADPKPAPSSSPAGLSLPPAAPTDIASAHPTQTTSPLTPR